MRPYPIGGSERDRPQKVLSGPIDLKENTTLTPNEIVQLQRDFLSECVSRSTQPVINSFLG